MVVKFEVDVDKEFKRALESAAKAVGDLTIPLTLITQSWFKSNRAIFDLKGPGKYEDLNKDYKPRKRAAVGFVYPILKRTGALERSITDPKDSDAISEIINGKTAILGSKIPYGPYHQLGTKKMPARPFVLIGAEQTAPPELNKRRDAWVALIEKFVLDKSSQFGKGTP